MRPTKVLLMCLIAGVGLQAATIIGTPATGGNSFPFGSSSGTRYQQVYDATGFPDPLTITGLTFYNSLNPGTTTAARTYTIHLSTTPAAVDALSGTMNDNVGLDDALFAIYVGGEVVNGSFTILGAPFYYNPSAGNLLMDIFVTGSGTPGSGFDARNGDAGGVFSRMHDFGTGYAGYGLVTGFETGTVIPEPGTMGLLGLGLGLAAWRRARK